MRKSSCWMILVALLTITTPTAFADSFSIVFTGGFTTPVDTSISVPSTGVLDLGTVMDGAATFTFTGPLTTTATPQTDLYAWQLVDAVTFIIEDSTKGTFAIASRASIFPPAPEADFGVATVTLNTVAAPEPSPVVLTLIGMGLLVVMRKRKALGLAQAT